MKQERGRRQRRSHGALLQLTDGKEEREEEEEGRRDIGGE